MATTNDSIRQDEEEYSQAFAQDLPEKAEMSEDEAFGLLPEAPEDGGEEGVSDGPEGEAPSIAIMIAPGEEADAMPQDAAPGDDPETGEGMDQSMDQAMEPMDPKDAQREKSWEGRLKAREAELKMREEALMARESMRQEERAEDPEHEAAEPAVTQAVEEAVDKVESGVMTVDQAIKGLSEDFGEEFAKMLGVLVEAKAKEAASQLVDDKVGAVNKTVDDIIADIVDSKARTHFETIAAKHPDFMELADSPAMQDYLASLPEADRMQAEKVVENGSAKEIVSLLDAVKAAQEPEPMEDPAQMAAMDAAEGVRSKGLKLPDKPRASADYESAWNEFS